MHPGLFAVCMFAIALVLNLVVSFFKFYVLLKEIGKK
jgi:hypothetical protein